MTVRSNVRIRTVGMETHSRTFCSATLALLAAGRKSIRLTSSRISSTYCTRSSQSSIKSEWGDSNRWSKSRCKSKVRRFKPSLTEKVGNKRTRSGRTISANHSKTISTEYTSSQHTVICSLTTQRRSIWKRTSCNLNEPVNRTTTEHSTTTKVSPNPLFSVKY